jgi:hypothetical protein
MPYYGRATHGHGIAAGNAKVGRPGAFAADLSGDPRAVSFQVDACLRCSIEGRGAGCVC